jgi:chorismate dehydratase
MAVRIALVSYLNTRPFLDGLRAGLGPEEAELLLLPPAQCAEALFSGRCDLALLPAGALAGHPELQVLPDYCIGADGPVHSVFLFAEEPVEQLDSLLLDRHSRSSNLLVQILLKHYWKRDLRLELPEVRRFDRIRGRTGGVAIGDEAIRLRDLYPQVYDLSACWKDLTGLPFTFAVWACRPGSIAPGLLRRIDGALEAGVQQAAASAERWAAHDQLPLEFAKTYLTRYIDYRFTAARHRALGLFLTLAAALEPAAVQQA